MGATFNPVIPWSELERRLSGRHRPGDTPIADGGDAPGFSRHRSTYEVPENYERRFGAVAYAELHCHSSFSFLDGASGPEELAEEAVRLGLEALAITDHNGFYGVVRFAEAARALSLSTIFGAELSLARGEKGHATARAGEIDPPDRHLLVLARDPEGYARLSSVMARAHLAGGSKGEPAFSMEELDEAHGGHWMVLTGCRHGAVPAALESDGPSAAARELDKLIDSFGAANVAIELFDHGGPLDSARNDALAALAVARGLEFVATTNAHYANASRYRLAQALAAVRARQSLHDVAGWLPAWSSSMLRSGAEQARRFARYPGAVEAAVAIGRSCAFDLRLLAPGLPPFVGPNGEDETSLLESLVISGARSRYGPPDAERIPGAWAQIEHEMAVIKSLGFAGYFLIVADIVEFCRRSNIYCQGRGSAANSAVCYALGITNVDAVKLGLLFERFLSSAREGPPDIDLDIESGERDQVIAYVYERYGREHAAQVANVITYRPRSAIRDVGKALGYSTSSLDKWSQRVGTAFVAHVPQLDDGGDGDASVIPAEVLALARDLEGLPRHLGIHSGGMVICDRPIIDVCPVEWARRDARSVLQWDKDDCAAIGLVKFDLLGLGMLEAIHRMVDLVRDHHRIEVNLADLPQEDGVYQMLSAGDSMGVFQVESRAQMATLPRLRPREFYDLVVEVALIRPGPIQGGSVHPYLRRRNGEEEVRFLHPLLEPALKKTLGVPLFQEQLMQIAIDVANFSAAEADQLRQAMGSKRSQERMARLKDRLYSGMSANGLPGDVCDAVFDQLAAFANFGFPESHSVSFAYLVYASAWFKRNYPAAFLAALLNSQPMGFWSPQSLVADARRHGVRVHRPDIEKSQALASLVVDEKSKDGVGVRLGLSSVRALSLERAEELVAHRPYTSIEDLVRRNDLTGAQLDSLATSGALSRLSPLEADARTERRVANSRRSALWAVGALAGQRADQLPGMVVGTKAPRLEPMSALEESAADLWSTGITTSTHPIAHLRAYLDQRGVLSAVQLADESVSGRVLVGGVVTHRQRPSTAGGTIFLNLEDETGVLNVICSRGLWRRYREIASSPALIVRGRLERAGGAFSVAAEHLEPLRVPARLGRSRDFR
jgi:error-prone DNA polymerase